jgi:4-hydroxyphenylpyruvate dioxygenase-like putative hemolysin
MIAVLKERQLTLSRKKSRIGALEEGFHFLGFDYQPTRRVDTITVTRASDAAIALSAAVQDTAAEFLDETGAPIEDHVLGPVRIVPHSRTLRKGRVQVRQRVLEGCSTRQIRRYLHRFLLWWVNISGSWQTVELGAWFVAACWDINKLHSIQVHGAGWGR